MPLERSDAISDLSDPNIVVGPRKRRPTERLLENGDPLACKKARKVVTDSNADDEGHTLSSMPPPPLLTRTTPPPTHLAHPMPLPTCEPNLRQVTNGAENRTSDGGQAIMVNDSDDEDGDTEKEGSDKGEVTDEDDDAELGMWPITLVCLR